MKIFKSFHLEAILIFLFYKNIIVQVKIVRHISRRIEQLFGYKLAINLRCLLASCGITDKHSGAFHFFSFFYLAAKKCLGPKTLCSLSCGAAWAQKKNFPLYCYYFLLLYFLRLFLILIYKKKYRIQTFSSSLFTLT